MRVRLCFSKSGALRFIGHLDLQRVFQRVIRRAGIPMAYSHGFNPHMLLSFALPLPLGMASENDYADLTLEAEISCTMAVDSINGSAPEGLFVKKAYPVAGKAAAEVVVADYAVKLSDDLSEEVIAEVLSRDSIVIPKKTKKGIKDTDIRADIFSLECSEETLFMRLAAGSSGFLHPVVVAELLLGEAPCPSHITRLELYRTSNEERRFVPL